MQNQVEKLNLLVADLLDISKIESGKLKFNRWYFSFDEVLDHIVEVMQQSHPQLKMHTSGFAGAELFGDEMRIEQVINNFITNAIKYAPDSDQIEIMTELCNDCVYFSVRDFGIGMSEEHQQKISTNFTE